ncbi:MAG: SRPBCC family protein [Bacteroidota bacterium]
MASNNKTTITAEPGKQELFITREFDAPRELVFKVMNDPKYMGRWLGPREYKMTVDKYEAKSGGAYRYIHSDDKGNSFGFHGVIHEISFPERAIQTFEFEGLPEKGHTSLETARFEELPGGRTRVKIQSVFQSVQDRDGMMQSDMERGVTDSHARLDDLLEEFKKQPGALAAE